MTYKDLAIKILCSDTEFLEKEVSGQELLNIVSNSDSLDNSDNLDNSDKLELEIQPYRGLPCAVDVFKINGQDADSGDFGSTYSCGDCMLGECCSHFKNIKPTNDVLKKYNITEVQFYQICDELKEKLHVDNCGWCS